MTEEQICRELGSVESVIAELKGRLPRLLSRHSKSDRYPSRQQQRLTTACHADPDPPCSPPPSVCRAEMSPDVLCDYNRDDFSEKFEMYTEGNTLVLREKPPVALPAAGHRPEQTEDSPLPFRLP